VVAAYAPIRPLRCADRGRQSSAISAADRRGRAAGQRHPRSPQRLDADRVVIGQLAAANGAERADRTFANWIDGLSRTAVAVHPPRRSWAPVATSYPGIPAPPRL